MIVDITGTILTPGNNGMACLGNGSHPETECCCDECNYLLCCLDSHTPEHCASCKDVDCPHAPQIPGRTI